jgi:hypothetical protein
MVSEKIHIWNNPDFNEVLIFYGLEAISFRDRKKAKELFDTLKYQLGRIQCDNWPYVQPIMVVIGIAGPTKLYTRRDVDNLSKVILDAGNKIVFADDRLVNILTIQKQLWEKPLYGFQVGVRVVDDEKKDKYSPTLCLTSYNDEKIPDNIIAPVIFHFENEADKEYVREQQKLLDNDKCTQ